MGQAKNRGSLEARINAAVQTKDYRIESLRKILGIPERVMFNGYLVKVDQTDEFLGAINNGVYGFVGAPENALSFNAFDDARNLARAEQGEIVVALFDFGSKLIVANVQDEPDTREPTLN
jgi:hypothetical protein